MRLRCKRGLAGVQVTLLLVFGIGCSTREAVTLSSTNDRPIGKSIEIQTPLGLPPVPIPIDNPETADAIALGRKLFYERRLSGDGSLSCASCHNPLIGFSNGTRYSAGVGGKIGFRNAPSIINAAYTANQFWDGRVSSLEEQAGGPMANPIEMNQSHEVTVSKLQADSAYREDFAKTFGPGPITIGKISKALANFERTVISGNSPFDRYEYGGDRSALTPAAIRGLAVFRDPGKGNCDACHTIGSKYALFTDGLFHNIGAGVNDEGNLTDLGRFAYSKVEAQKGAFKTPSLRNVAQSAPYMHDGSLKTLKGVVDFYAGGGNSNPYLDPRIKSIQLSGQDRADLIAFLEALTGDLPPDSGPPMISSARIR